MGESEADAEDLRLIQAVSERNAEALKVLYQRYGGLLYALAFRIVGESQTTEEVVQDVFLRCWDRSATFDQRRGSVSSWLMSIARNRAIDSLRGAQHRARRREQQLPATLLERPGPGSIDPGEVVSLRLTLGAALESLPSRQREAIALATYGGLTQAEIAKVLGVPLGTIKSRIRDGMLRLRLVLDSENRSGRGARCD
jgi:RNA polymerase sigma-70 factor (ECF subfamily)